MSLLSAGKQISLGQDKSYGRGLFVIDPDEAQRKARKQLEYQQQLRAQMEEARRRKMQLKKKEDDEDKRWEQKFKEDVKRQSQKKNEKPQQINDKNFNNKTQKSQVTIRPDFHKEQIKNIRKTQESQAPINMRRQIENDVYENPYSPKIMNYQYNQQQHFFEQSSQQKLKLMREVLDEKMNEVYNKIKQSKNLQIERQIDSIRKKIITSNNSYESQNPKTTQLPHQFSQFYRIPKKNTYGNPQVKNLNYDSRVQYKRNEFSANNQSYPSRQKDSQIRSNAYNPKFQNNTASRERESQSGQDQRKWGLNKGKSNFLGNREALDYQIQTILNSIDKNLIQHGQN